MIICKTFFGYFNKIEEDANEFLQSVELSIEDVKFTRSEDKDGAIHLTLFYQVK